MSHAENKDVPRTYDDPTPDAVFEAMEVGRCYVAADLVAEFPSLEPTRRTLHNRLTGLADEGRVIRQEHENGSVTFQRPHPAITGEEVNE